MRTASILCLLALLSPAAAGAEPAFEPGLSLSFSYGRLDSGSATVTAFAPFVHGTLPIGEDYGLTADLGYIQSTVDTDGLGSASSGSFLNPAITLHRRLIFGEQPVRVGLGVALPLASTGAVNEAGYAAAGGSSGAWNPWFYSPRHFGLLVPASTRWWLLSDKLYLSLGGTLSLLIPTKDGANTTYGAQAATEAIFPLGVIDLGARLQAVFSADSEDSMFQSAVGPMIGLHLGSINLSAMLLYNIDAPLGPSFVDDNPWGLYIGGGLSI